MNGKGIILLLLAAALGIPVACVREEGPGEGPRDIAFEAVPGAGDPQVLATASSNPAATRSGARDDGARGAGAQTVSLIPAREDAVPRFRLKAEASAIEAAAKTRATAVTAATLDETGFYVSATRGSAGSETSAWSNVAFVRSSPQGPFTAAGGGKWWPESNPGYHFYAANVPMTPGAGGATIAASAGTDIVCASLPSPSYRSLNTLPFEHIFARLGAFTVTAADPAYAVSDVSVTFTPYVSGTYDIRAGAGHSDRTGWSGLVAGASTSVAPASPGTRENDCWLVPGAYVFAMQWTVTQGSTSVTYDASFSVSLQAGKTHTLSVAFTGLEGDFTPDLGTFGGLNIAPAPLYYNGTTFVVKDEDWNHDSYGTARGKTAGSYFFSFSELGTFFDSRGASFTASSGSIDNAGGRISCGDYADWRLPTIDEWRTIVTTSADVRPGSTVNGIESIHYIVLQLSGVSHAGTTYPIGILLFPDGQVLTGKALSVRPDGKYDAGTLYGVTQAELDNYLEQGCVFLPGSGYNGNSYGGEEGNYASATQRDGSYALVFQFYADGGAIISFSSYSFKSTYTSVRLVRDAT